MDSVVQSKTILGDVKLGKNCFLSNSSMIDAGRGPIILGDFNILEERARIVNTKSEPLVIGSYNLFQVGCKVENTTVGSHCKFEPRSLLQGCTVLNNTTVGPICELRDRKLPQGYFIGCGFQQPINHDSASWSQFLRQYQSTLQQLSGQKRK